MYGGFKKNLFGDMIVLFLCLNFTTTQKQYD